MNSLSLKNAHQSASKTAPPVLYWPSRLILGGTEQILIALYTNPGGCSDLHHRQHSLGSVFVNTRGHQRWQQVLLFQVHRIGDGSKNRMHQSRLYSWEIKAIITHNRLRNKRHYYPRTEIKISSVFLLVNNHPSLSLKCGASSAPTQPCQSPPAILSE